jgi:PAT family beta-lactamase induction signal transducer AmpG
VGVILYMMQVVAPGKYTTAHYAFSTGMMQLGFVLFRWVSGDIQTALGYKNFFVWVLLAAIPVAILSQFIPMESREKATGDAELEAA